MSEKVFCVGFHKTGTSSLSKALEMLGLHVNDAQPELVEPLREGDLRPVLEAADAYDALQDDPWFLLYEELDRRFPGSKFILTERDTEKWVRSMQRHLGSSAFVHADHAGAEMRRFMYGPVGADQDPERYARLYEAHNRAVKEYFAEAGEEERLLVLRLGEGSEWQKLCSFLGRPVPRRLLTRRPLPFPRTNSEAQRRFHRRHKWVNRLRGRTKQWIRKTLGERALRVAREVHEFALYKLRL